MSDMSKLQWDDRYSQSGHVWSLDANQFVEAYLADLPAGTAIDLGAGEGRNAVWLAQRGWQVEAVDFSSVALDKAQSLAERHSVKISTVCADATVFEASEPVDLVVVVYLQLSPLARRKAIDHAVSWVKPGGTLFIVAHDVSNIADGYGGPPSEEVCYDVDETVSRIDGFQISTAEVVKRRVDTSDGPRIALDTLVIARRPTHDKPAP